MKQQGRSRNESSSVSSFPAVTDAGLENLAAVNFLNTEVTAAGVEKLQNQLPKK
jgi:hypothetical protein